MGRVEDEPGVLWFGRSAEILLWMNAGKEVQEGRAGCATVQQQQQQVRR